ncbi:UDP-N-acetylmuramyl pentapeptide phosphotransferase/UDP-N-acetylglucosamine-1-phosphate transferase [Gelidibacter sediminis]|uniref:UDP-N-acetylmuramyl pentapeptide phosphotransferase/UDP-N-acetylglucosamine-1-phosphate transferase n=1 Tax=Gelidibacter sediminis TaxID=1608710 RepID=A0A4R7Q5X9_9FLAO|nr:MraY family glycosyltransferase [Gelidibacter sediminis]TDU42878.1 UDP-N-acetylmuramyl pentapeptide phosphotransferase/UDP-N-acetylglucosamine-1-phosphate transferase [Gelidibacter sediminis]
MIQTFFDNFSPQNNALIWLIGAFALAFVIAHQTFPSILYVTMRKRLMDVPDSRSMHIDKTPTLGGIGIFFSIVVVMTTTGAMLNTKLLLLVMGGLTILFFLGLKDDLTVLSARNKFIGQLFAAVLLIVFTDTRIIGFSKIFGVEELPYWISIFFTLFVYILIINAYNLIDGVDGLAGSVGLVISAVFLVLFYNSGNLSLATISVALIGALLAFLRLNMSARRKIFMGDTGSMIVGFLLAFFTISFISQSQTNVDSEYFRASPALALAMLFYPLMDTFRIFFIRIFVLKQSPFKADKNHIHHRYIQMGYTHLQTTFIIVITNLIVVLIAFNMLHLNLNMQIGLLLLYGTILFFAPIIFKRKFHTFKKKRELSLNGRRSSAVK